LLNRCVAAAYGFGSVSPGSQASGAVQVLDGSQCLASHKERRGRGAGGGSITGSTKRQALKEVPSSPKGSAPAPATLHAAWGHEWGSRGQCTTERSVSESRHHHPGAGHVASPTSHQVQHPHPPSSRPAVMSRGKADAVVSAAASQRRGSRCGSRPAPPHNVHLGSSTTRAPSRVSSPAMRRLRSSSELGKGVRSTCRPLSRDRRDSSETSSSDTPSPSRHLSLGAGPDDGRRWRQQRGRQLHPVPKGEPVGREAAAAAAVAPVVASASATGASAVVASAATAATGATADCSTDSDPWFWLSKADLADRLAGVRGAGVWSSSSSPSSPSSPSAAAAGATARHGTFGGGLVAARRDVAAVGGGRVDRPRRVGPAAAGAPETTDASSSSPYAAGGGRNRAAVFCVSPVRHHHDRPPTTTTRYRRPESDDKEMTKGASSAGNVDGCDRNTAGQEATRRRPVSGQLGIVGVSQEAKPDHRRCRREHSGRRQTSPRLQESREQHRHHRRPHSRHPPGHGRCHSTSRSSRKCRDGFGATAASRGGSGGGGDESLDGMLRTCRTSLGVAPVSAAVEAAARAGAAADPPDFARADVGANPGSSGASSQSAAKVATLPRPLVPQPPRRQLHGTGAKELAAMAATDAASSVPPTGPTGTSIDTPSMSAALTHASVSAAVASMPAIEAHKMGSSGASSTASMLPRSAAPEVVRRTVESGEDKLAATEAEANGMPVTRVANAAAAPGVMEVLNGAAAVSGRPPYKESEVEGPSIPLPVSFSVPAAWLEALDDEVMSWEAYRTKQLATSDGAEKASRQCNVGGYHPLLDAVPVPETAELGPCAADGSTDQHIDLADVGAATQAAGLCPAACLPLPPGHLHSQQSLLAGAGGSGSNVGFETSSEGQCPRPSAVGVGEAR
ncbi:hypothetical protein Vretimale_19685, partial [Volvox reticuliferus]